MKIRNLMKYGTNGYLFRKQSSRLYIINIYIYWTFLTDRFLLLSIFISRFSVSFRVNSLFHPFFKIFRMDVFPKRKLCFSRLQNVGGYCPLSTCSLHGLLHFTPSGARRDLTCSTLLHWHPLALVKAILYKNYYYQLRWLKG